MNLTGNADAEAVQNTPAKTSKMLQTKFVEKEKEMRFDFHQIASV